MNFKRNICLGFFLSALAHGGELTVRNGDFETPQAAESNEVGQWHESRVGKLLGGYLLAKGSKDLPDTPDGKQWLELIGQPNIPADVYQQIGTWEAGKYCTVSLLLGNRGILADSGLRLELWAGGDVGDAQPGKALDQIGARLLSEASNIGLPPNGETFSVTRSLASGDKGKPGEPLWLRLVQHGDLQQNSVVLIDNVTAKWTDEAVEPAPETLPENPTPVANASSPYVVRDIPVPEGVVVEAGGVCYWPDGTLLVATRRGDVWTVKDGRWNLFATGLMEPMGIWADTVGEVFVTQAPELTRIQDLDGDLSADRYGTVTAGWDMPGARTDFVFGLCRDPQGNFYGTMHTTHAPWAEAAKKSKFGFGGPMGAPVIGRGWSFQVDPKGKLTWWSSGLRAPNGLSFNAEGDLFSAENQGDWVGTSALHHIEQGDFHGHPSSYQWDPKRIVSLEGPLNELAAKLDPIRKRPVVLFPHGILGNSPSQPVLAPADGTFGPFAGQFFVGDNVAPLVSRVFLEKIDGEYQGACFPFIREQGLRKALSRMTFSPEGKLVIEFGCRGWGPATEGLQEVSWSGETSFEMQTINLQSDGFRITFTKPLAEQVLEKAVAIKSYRYKYHHLYGSPQVDVEQSEITGISVSLDRRVVTLLTSPLKAGKIYEFALKGVTAADGEPLANHDAYYTANKLSGVSSAEAPVSLTGRTIIPIATTTPGAKKPAGEWTFFPFCMDQHDSKRRDLAAQAKLFRELGYDGAGHLSQEFGYAGVGTRNVTVEQRAETLAAEGLRLVHTYARVFLDNETPIDLKRLAEAMPTLAKHRSQLILLFVGNRKADLDDKAVAILGEIADIAKPHGVEIAIYPHNKDYTQTIGEALRLVKKLNRPDEVGVMFTFTHWQLYDPNRDIRAVLTGAAPYLKSVSINGSRNESPSVLPLSQGDFDNTMLLDILRDIGFDGTIGLMCWGIPGDARDHLTASIEKWKSLTSSAKTTQLRMNGDICEFETSELKGRIGDGRFIGVNQLVHKPSGIMISGDKTMNRHGLLTPYRVFTRNHRYGEAAYAWPEREISISGEAVAMLWPATAERPFEMRADYSFPKPNEVRLQVSVKAREELVDFEVQVGSYFDESFPNGQFRLADNKLVSAPKELGIWQAFPRDEQAIAIIGDGRWKQGVSPVTLAIRDTFLAPVSMRRHSAQKLTAVLRAGAEDSFALYSSYDGEAHFANYHALFGRSIPAGATATASVTLSVGEWADGEIIGAE